MDRHLAKDTLEGLIALDQPLGRLVELTNETGDTARKAVLKACCSTLLRAQFDLIERITRAYPDLHHVDPK